MSFANYLERDNVVSAKPFPEELLKEIIKVIAVARKHKIKCTWHFNQYRILIRGRANEGMVYEHIYHNSIGLDSLDSIRTHPCEDPFDSLVKVVLMLFQKYGLIVRWATDSSEHSPEWQEAVSLAKAIGLDYTKYMPRDSMAQTGFYGDL